MTTSLNHRQIVSYIKAMGHKRTILIEGEAGWGKTSILHSFRNDPFFANFDIYEPFDATQMSDGSIFALDIDRERGVGIELPNERFGLSATNRRGVPGSRPVLMLIDELGKARQMAKDGLAPIVLEHRIGEWHFPEGSIIICATNLSEEGLNDSFQAHLINRMQVLRKRKPTQKEWVQDFAIPAGLAPELIAATEMFPLIFESFMDYTVDGKYANQKIEKNNPYIANPQDASQRAFVSGRSLHAASDTIIACRDAGVDDETLQAALEGTVGAPFASQLTSFIRFGRDIPSFARVCENPEKTPLSDNPTAQIVQVFQFITQTQDAEQAAAVCKYVGRMQSEMQALFINTVAGSTRVALFSTSTQFRDMLIKNRELFSGV
jgi:hypothetical protein